MVDSARLTTSSEKLDRGTYIQRVGVPLLLEGALPEGTMVSSLLVGSMYLSLASVPSSSFTVSSRVVSSTPWSLMAQARQ
jgi:hypothetical protein